MSNKKDERFLIRVKKVNCRQMKKGQDDVDEGYFSLFIPYAVEWKRKDKLWQRHVWLPLQSAEFKEKCFAKGYRSLKAKISKYFQRTFFVAFLKSPTKGNEKIYFHISISLFLFADYLSFIPKNTLSNNFVNNFPLILLHFTLFSLTFI